MGMLWKAGIEIPAMYKMGYNNNNCIGCVKGGMGYWNKIRKDFPKVFDRMAKIEREVGATCLKDQSGKYFLMSFLLTVEKCRKNLYRIALLYTK